MTTQDLEQDILEKFNQLDKEARQRVHQRLATLLPEDSVFNFEAWLAEVNTLRQHLLLTATPVDAIALLRDLRDGEDE